MNGNGNGALRAFLAGVLAVCAVSTEAQRSIPKPMPEHPGNIFLSGESVSVALPVSARGWRLLDYDGKEIARVPADTRNANLGKLPVGFYRLWPQGSDAWISLGVLEPLKAPTPLTSPIGVDVAMAWFYKTDRMQQVASLCSLAGMNRVRDRLAWAEIEPERDHYAGRTRYDDSAQAQSAAGLQVLQVNHSSPPWANPDRRRFPLDLRDAFNFYREMARRWKGQVVSFEPWNEADIEGFGGHSGAEMAALQKASYLGLKAGNPDVTACLNVFASHNRAQLEDLAANEAWPYFDTYDLHHYEGLEGYPRLYADHRAVSAGRPMWVTECAMPVRWSGSPDLQEPSEADLKIQAERVARVYAGSLHEGAAATFYFILGHYVEGQTQFGILRRDLTPRPAYLALAAAGRLLADARPLGRIRSDDTVSAYAFRARPEGQERVVIVAWTRDGTANLGLPAQPEAMSDHLGRSIRPARILSLTTAPVFAILPTNAISALPLAPAPSAPRWLPGRASPVVLQVVWPVQRKLLFASAYRVSSTEPTEATLVAYNFGSASTSGTIRAEMPKGWRLEGLYPLALGPMGRAELKVSFVPGKSITRTVETVRIVGSFGAGKAVASARLAPQGSSLVAKPGIVLPGATDPRAWELMVSGGPKPTAVPDAGGVLFAASPVGDPWFYPRIKLPERPPVPRGAIGLACTITLLQGEGQFRAIFDEKNGSSYVADFVEAPQLGVPTKTVALFDGAIHGDGWSAPDPRGSIDPSQIVALKIGLNGKASKVRFRLSDVRWVRQ